MVDYSYLKGLGFTITVKNENLRIEPKDKLTPELVSAIKNNKQIIIKQVAEDTLHAGGSVRIYSKVLDDYFILASRPSKQQQDTAVYTVSEIMSIIRSRPNKETLQNIHSIKKAFGGGVAAVETYANPTRLTTCQLVNLITSLTHRYNKRLLHQPIQFTKLDSKVAPRAL